MTVVLLVVARDGAEHGKLSVQRQVAHPVLAKQFQRRRLPARTEHSVIDAFEDTHGDGSIAVSVSCQNILQVDYV